MEPAENENRRVVPIDEEYEEKLDRFAAENDMSREAVEQSFREYCSMFHETTDGKPNDVIRRLAFHKLKWHFS